MRAIAKRLGVDDKTVRNDLRFTAEFSHSDSYNLKVVQQILESGTDHPAVLTEVQGIEGWEVSTEGEMFHLGVRHRTGGRNQPTVNLGPDYTALPPAYDTRGEVFLDELVAATFHPRPGMTLITYQPLHARIPVAGLQVHYIDGDWSNCRADNLQWLVDLDWLEQFARRSYLALTVSPVPPAPNGWQRGKPRGKARKLERERWFVGSDHYADYMPKPSKKTTA